MLSTLLLHLTASVFGQTPTPITPSRKPLNVIPKRGKIPIKSWGMDLPAGKATSETGEHRGLYPNPVPSHVADRNIFFTSPKRMETNNDSATNNLPGAKYFRPGRVRLPSKFKNHQKAFFRSPEPGTKAYLRSKLMRNRFPVKGGKSKGGEAGSSSDQAKEGLEQLPAEHSAGHEFVQATTGDGAFGEQQHSQMHTSGTIDVLGSIPSGRHYKTYMDVSDGGNFTLIFAVCSGHLEMDVHVDQESVFDYTSMYRRRRQSHGLRLRYQTPFLDSQTGLGVGEESAAIGAMTELDLDAGEQEKQ